MATVTTTHNWIFPHIRVLNHVFVMNVATIQPRNGYNQYYFAMDSTFFEAKLTTLRSGRGQMLEAKAKILASKARSQPSLETLTSLGVPSIFDTSLSSLQMWNLQRYDILGGRNILWPLRHMVRGLRPHNPRIRPSLSSSQPSSVSECR